MRRDVQHIPLWVRAPFIRLLPPFVLGIITGYFFEVDSKVLIIAALAIVAASLYERTAETAKFRYRSIPGVLLIFLLFLLGIFVFKIHYIPDKKDWYGHYLSEAAMVQVVIQSAPQEKAKSYKITGKVTGLINEDMVIPVLGKVLLYIEKDTSAERLRQGDILIVANGFNEVKTSGNPGSFDYKKFLSFQGVYHQAFVKGGGWRKVGHRKLSVISAATNAAVAYSQRTIEKRLHGAREISLAKALLTGDRSTLDRDLVQAYANTGVVHIMAISGLHIGLIYLFLIQFLSFIPFINNRNKIKFYLVLGGVWFFAFMTGLSPSVVRASIMFSFLTLGILKRHRGSTYNYWAAAAFFMLCFNPILLFNVGFQLSFSAVLGILVAQRAIYKWIYFENKIVNYIWEIVSLTISAQLFTLPFIAFYFHQFPSLFIIANIAAIPLASVGLWLGVLLLFFSWIPVISQLLGIAAEWVFRGLNNTIIYINGSGFSVLDGFYPNLSQAVLLMAFISGILYWLLYQNSTAFKYSLLVLAGLLVINTYKVWKANEQSGVIFYDIPQAAAIDFVMGNRYMHRYFSTYTTGDRGEKEINISRNVLRIRAEGVAIHSFAWGDNELYIGKHTVLHVKNAGQWRPNLFRREVDVLVLSDIVRSDISELIQVLHPRLVVFTSANRRYRVEKWKDECLYFGVKYHDIYEDGALLLHD